MATLLQLDSSGKGSKSVTRPLTHYYAEKWSAANPGGKVVYHDLLTSNLPFVDEKIVGAFYTPSDNLTPEQKDVLALPDQLVQELLECDTYVFGVPMYNFGAPAVFKAYIDLVVRAGKTFSYDNGVPKGFLQGKRLIVVTSSGGDYATIPMKAYDFLEPYVRGLFGFLGVTDIHVISAWGRDPATIEANSERAREQLENLVS